MVLEILNPQNFKLTHYPFLSVLPLARTLI
jgi:hypothetical protein